MLEELVDVVFVDLKGVLKLEGIVEAEAGIVILREVYSDLDRVFCGF